MLLERFPHSIGFYYLLQAVQVSLMTAIFAAAIVLPRIGVASYRRRIERCADLESVALINSHQGGVAFLDRCVRELGHSSEWGWWQSCILDHPSHAERKKYILAHQQQSVVLHS